MRALQPGRLVSLASGLWVVDAFQPVAAVLDPDTGALRTLVSWPEVPPPGVAAGRAQVVGDGGSVWMQDETGAPVVRIDIEGARVVTSMGPAPSQMRLRAVGPGAAWCSTTRPEATYARTGEGRGLFPGHGELRRVDAVGVVQTVRVGRGVEQLHSTPNGLVVGVPSSTWRAWRNGYEETRRDLRWYLLPWDAPVPEHLGDGFAMPNGFEPPPAADASVLDPSMISCGVGWVHDPEARPDQAPAAQSDGLDWFVEPIHAPGPRGPLWDRRKVRAFDGSGTVVADWDLSDGSVVALAALGPRVAVAVARERRNAPRGRADRVVDVLALDPRDGSRQDLIRGGSLDVSEHCWPVGPRPADADSSVRHCQDEVTGRLDRLQRAGAQDVQVAVTGSWPRTVLETTMTVPARPGVRLRLRVPLFDEVGRALGPQYADAGLADALDVDFLPAAEDARDGFLDV